MSNSTGLSRSIGSFGIGHPFLLIMESLDLVDLGTMGISDRAKWPIDQKLRRALGAIFALGVAHSRKRNDLSDVNRP